MTKLNDTQLVLLTAAGQREAGSLLPIPTTISSKPEQIRRALQGLIKKALVTEVDVRSADAAFLTEGDRRIGLVINDAGRSILGITEPAAADQPPETNQAAPELASLRSGTKQTLLLEMVQRKEGASVGEIIEATGWLAHTTRAAITGLRKRGHDIVLEKIHGASRYCSRQVAG